MAKERRAISPIGVLALGAVAGAIGTAMMDLVWYRRYKRGGGEQTLIAWDTAEGVEKWDQASAPGLVGKRLVEGFTQQELPDSWARPMVNGMHWVYGIAWGAQYGVLAGSLRRRWALAAIFGPIVWASAYVLLPLAKLYKPMWEYDAATLGKDLSAHWVYGAATGAAFSALLAAAAS